MEHFIGLFYFSADFCLRNGSIKMINFFKKSKQNRSYGCLVKYKTTFYGN